jgi:hypothetical protein
MECVASHFQQSLMESLPLKPCGKTESSQTFARHLNCYFVAQNPFSLTLPTSFVTPSLKHMHVSVKMQNLFISK